MELNVGCSICIVRQLLVVVVAIVLVTHSKSLVPRQTVLLPIVEPFHFRARLAEELHFHLFKFAHTEHELAGYYLVAESLSNLCNTERQLHATSLLNIQEINKDTLCRLRTQINRAR